MEKNSPHADFLNALNFVSDNIFETVTSHNSKAAAVFETVTLEKVM